MYKVCLLTAGMGTRNAYAKHTNKSLLPLGDKPVFAHILDKIPEDIEIVVPLGHYGKYAGGSIVKRYPNRKIQFVWVDKYSGEGSGPGYSLLKCKDYLQCPFIFVACDTIVIESYPPPDRNWIGVGNVDNPKEYLTVDTRNWYAQRFYDKVKSGTHLAFIGLAGVRDYEAFWEGLEHPALVQGEHQVTDGLKSLLDKGVTTKIFSWMDIGKTEDYEKADRFFNQIVS